MNATMYANANDGYVRSGAASYATARSTGSAVESAAVGTIVATTTESPPMWLSVRLAGWPHYQKLTIDHKFSLDVIFPEALAA